MAEYKSKRLILFKSSQFFPSSTGVRKFQGNQVGDAMRKNKRIHSKHKTIHKTKATNVTIEEHIKQDSNNNTFQKKTYIRSDYYIVHDNVAFIKTLSETLFKYSWLACNARH